MRQTIFKTFKKIFIFNIFIALIIFLISSCSTSAKKTYTIDGPTSMSYNSLVENYLIGRINNRIHKDTKYDVEDYDKTSNAVIVLKDVDGMCLISSEGVNIDGLLISKTCEYTVFANFSDGGYAEIKVQFHP